MLSCWFTNTRCAQWQSFLIGSSFHGSWITKGFQFHDASSEAVVGFERDDDDDEDDNDENDEEELELLDDVDGLALHVHDHVSRRFALFYVHDHDHVHDHAQMRPNMSQPSSNRHSCERRLLFVISLFVVVVVVKCFAKKLPASRTSFAFSLSAFARPSPSPGRTRTPAAVVADQDDRDAGEGLGEDHALHRSHCAVRDLEKSNHVSMCTWCPQCLQCVHGNAAMLLPVSRITLTRCHTGQPTRMSM